MQNILFLLGFIIVSGIIIMGLVQVILGTALSKEEEQMTSRLLNLAKEANKNKDKKD